MSKLARCILHIGTEKTGTSTIQRFLATNRERLRAEQMVYTNCSGLDGGSQTAFVVYAQQRPWTNRLGQDLGVASPSAHAAFKRRIERVVQEATELCPEGTLLISSEHFHSRLVEVEEIAALKGLLEPYVENFEIIAYLRRQDRLAVSSYSTKIKSGAVAPVVFPGMEKGGAPLHYFDFLGLYKKWGAVFGEKALNFRLFERSEFVGQDLLVDFSSCVGFGLVDKETPSKVNESLNQDGADFLLQVNKILAKGEENARRTSLHAMVSRLCSGKMQVATKADAQAFYNIYAPSNEALRSVAFSERQSPLFDDDFSEYPDSVATERSYDAAVHIAVEVWAKAMQAEKKLRSENHYFCALLAHQRGDLDAALQGLMKSIESRPNYIEAHVELAKIHSKLGDNEALRKDIEKIARLDKSSRFSGLMENLLS